MLLMDGVRYLRHDYRDEAELESMVKEHATDIFGEDSLYFDIKQKVGGSSVAAIPDGYAITFNPDQWWMVEVELSSHDVYGHIQPQIGKFLASIGQHQTKVELQDRLFSEINSDDHTKLNLHRKKGTEIFKFLSDLLGQTPKVAIIIDHKVPALADLKKALPTAPEVIEFVTFCREGVGVDVHIHQFEPLFVRGTAPLLPGSPAPSQPHIQHLTGKKRRCQLSDLIRAGLVKAEQKIWHVHKGVRYEARILDSGQIALDDGTVYKSTSGASDHLTKTSTDGWVWWQTELNGRQVPLDELRKEYERTSHSPPGLP